MNNEPWRQLPEKAGYSNMPPDFPPQKNLDNLDTSLQTNIRVDPVFAYS